MQSELEVKVGCCGFAVSQQEYFQLFKLIEIQHTFYQLPRLKTAEKWRSAAPHDFEFTMKAWQLITHKPTSPTYRRLREKIALTTFDRYGYFQPTREVFDAWNRTERFARILGASIIVFQCPASFRPDNEHIANMREFFTRIDREGFRFVWEPRGAWPEELILHLCEDLQLIHCVDPFQRKPQYRDFQYFRLHGITGYAYHYTDAEIQRLKTWAAQKSTYVLFNNQSMKDDALEFRKLMQTRA
jgi:uncharacterized protein YecE (DUF72 family)